MLTYTKSYKSSTMNKQTFVLETKTQNNGVRGERIQKVVATTLSEAVQMFA